MQKLLQTVSIYWEASIFMSDNGVLTLFCFMKTMRAPDHQESDFQSSFYAFECKKDVPTNCLKFVTDKRQKPVVWTYSLAITPQPKGAIFSHRKRWMVSMGLKHQTIMWKHRFQHLKAFFIHFMQFCGPWITHKKWHSNVFRPSFKMTKILVSNIFYHFLFAVSLGNGASKMSEKI